MRNIKLFRAHRVIFFIKLVAVLFIAEVLILNLFYNQSAGGGSDGSSNSTFHCNDYIPRSHYGQRGNYGVLYNYIKATKWFHCDESITFTTHAEWTFLDNLIPLLERWQGPLSLALYTPGTDFYETVKRVQYYRECHASPLVKELVTFHLFFDLKHVPKGIHPFDDVNSIPVNCTELRISIFDFGLNESTFKKAENLTYPINVARNVAKEMATTHFVFPSDIELYPSPNLIPQFLQMIQRNETILQTPNPKVFVLPIFEVEATITQIPKVKKDLVYLLKNKTAVLFHKYVCSSCHRVPKMDQWIKANVSTELNIFHVGKRHNPFHTWEPIYIGTKSDPMYDERLSWEGRSDKMTQAYILCILDYEFLVLNNAFLVHRPGIKRKGHPIQRNLVRKQNELISKTIKPEIEKIYGNRSGCVIH